MPYQPPFTISPLILNLVADISERIGRVTAQRASERYLRLRKENRIRTIQGSLAIEGNTLNTAQITAILEGKRIIAPPREVLEVQNALNAYDHLPKWNPINKKHLLQAHHLLMTGLIPDAGYYRSGGVGVMSGEQVVHMSPGADQVPRLMANLFKWLKRTDLPALISSTIFHYEFEFIHPFADGNGRMGRLWQTLVLSQWQPIFIDIPIESLIHQHQTEYYQAIRSSTAQTDSAPFIEFMLKIILETLKETMQTEDADHPVFTSVQVERDNAPVATMVKMQVKTSVQMQVEIENIQHLKTSEQILVMLAKYPSLTLLELATLLNKSTSTIERAVAKLKHANKLKFIGAKKSGVWRVI